MFRTAVSPYHLTTREAPAMAALLLGDEVVTLVPSPSEGSPTLADVAAAAEALPTFAEFMDSWRWSVPLWRAGVIASVADGESMAGEIGRVCGEIADEARYGALRPLMHREWLEDRARYLDALAGDLLKGGPNPAVSVPVLAALDRFSARHGLASFRAAPTSVAQQAEARLGARVLTCSVPILTQAEGGTHS